MHLTLTRLFTVLYYVLNAVSILIAIYCILSWFMTDRNPLFHWISVFIKPFVAPFRGLWRLITRKVKNPVDLSCWLAVIGIQILCQLIRWANLLYKVPR